MSNLSGDLSGVCRVNLANPTTVSLSQAITWMPFVGNVGSLGQERVPEAFTFSATRARS